MEQIRKLKRPAEVPDAGLLCDLLWSDPEKDIMGWADNDRGVSVVFGEYYYSLDTKFQKIIEVE